MTMGPGSPGPVGLSDGEWLAFGKRIEVSDNLDDDTDWIDENPSDLVFLVRMSVWAVMTELSDLDWPERVGIGVLFGSDAEVANLNARFRSKPTPTNVLSFPSEELAPGDAPPAYLGDLAFAYGVVLAEAREREIGFDRYLPVLAVHGILHLVGHDHETSDADAEAMERLEARALARLGLPDPYRDTLPDTCPDTGPDFRERTELS